MLKRCLKCGESKPLNMFRLRRGLVTARCRACLQAYDRERYAKNREEQIARCRNYREANRETVRECSRKSHLRHRDHRNAETRARREANREQYLAARKCYRQKNAEKIKAADKEWRDKNGDRIRKYRQERVSEANAATRKYRAKRGPKYIIAEAKNVINQTTGIPFRHIPLSLAEAKAAQLAVLRATRNRRS